MNRNLCRCTCFYTSQMRPRKGLSASPLVRLHGWTLGWPHVYPLGVWWIGVRCMFTELEMERKMDKNHNSVVVLRIPPRLWWMMLMGVKDNHTKYE